MRTLLLTLSLIAGCARVNATQHLEPVLARREAFESAPEFGGEMFVLEAGPADGPPLVLIHGLGEAGARDFEPVLPALSRRYRVLVFDLPGLARSKHRGDIYSPQRYAKLVSALITRHFGTRPVALLGHSMGGGIALELAAHHPEQVSRLLLLDVSGVLHYREYLREVIAGSTARQPLWKRTLLGAREVLFNIGMFPARRMKLEDMALDVSPTLRGFFSSSRVAALLYVQHDLGPAIRSVRAPTWVGWGALDTVAPLRTATLLRAQLPGAQLHTFVRSGHLPMRTEPAALTEALSDFLDAPAEIVEPTPRPNATGRDGVCRRRSERIFEGDYDTITIHRCKDVTLRNVRARSIAIDRSEVVLENVELESLDVAATIRRSRVRWTGGRVRGDICVETDGSALNLAGVQCVYRRRSIEVRQPSRFVASASALSGETRETALHGEYELFRTVEGQLRELRTRGDPRSNLNSKTALASDRMAGAWLVAEDLQGVSLEGVNLEGAQLRSARLDDSDLRGASLRNASLVQASLRGADLRAAQLDQADLREADLCGADMRTALGGVKLEGAWFDDKTRFPRDFDPLRHGMRARP